MNTLRTLSDIARRLVEAVPDEVADDLRSEDPVSAIEVHYAPIRLHELPNMDLESSDCSVDGYYDSSVDPLTPRIMFASGVVAARVRFTLLHELGHHLLATDAAPLLDDIDRLAGSSSGATNRAEELICHEFAGRLLIPEGLLIEVIGSDRLKPKHCVELHERSLASWEAVAVRAACHGPDAVAVALIRHPGRVAFVASTGLGAWPRESFTKADGPLARSLRVDARGRVDTYRHGLGYSEEVFCDSDRVTGRLAVAVLARRRSDRAFAILDQTDPSWTNAEDFCKWCSTERGTDWCDSCKGRLCNDCGRCGCTSGPRENPVCSACGLRQPVGAGSAVCLTCEADGHR